MVGSISSVSLLSGVSSASSTSTSSTDLASRLAAKQQALAAAGTADERKSIQAEIDALKAQMDAQSSSGASSRSRSEGAGRGGPPPGGPPAGGPPPGGPQQQGSTANIGKKNFDSSTPFGNRQIYV